MTKGLCSWALAKLSNVVQSTLDNFALKKLSNQLVVISDHLRNTRGDEKWRKIEED